MNINGPDVAFEYRQFQMGLTENDGIGYDVVSQYVDIYFGEQTPTEYGLSDSTVKNFRIQILKKSPEEHHRMSFSRTPIDNCNTSLQLYIQTKDEEYKIIAAALKPYARPNTCDEFYSLESVHKVELKCSQEAALLALEKVVEVSKGCFGEHSKEWLAQAKEFVTHAPQTQFIKKSLDPAFEAKIRETLGNQEGAMNLLEDLKKKPYNSDVEMILRRLVGGSYGTFSTEHVCSTYKLVADLERRGYNDLAKLALDDRYEHDGPNREANLNKLFSQISDIFGKEKNKL